MQEIDVEQLMERIRDNVRRRKTVEEPRTANLVSPFHSGQAAADLAFLHSAYDVQNIAFVSHRGGFGPLVIAAKKLLRKLLTPILERQVSYNAANARVTTHIKEWMETLEELVTRETQLGQELCREIRTRQARLGEEFTAASEDIAMLRSDLVAARDDLALVRDELATLRKDSTDELAALRQDSADRLAALRKDSANDLASTQADFATSKERLARAERRLRRLSHALEAFPAHANGGQVAPAAEAAPAPRRLIEDPDFDYVEFAEKFRGTEQDIRERQRCYVPYFEGARIVVDIGCGRGEFLELLRDHGIKGRGVDLDLDMILVCRDKGLDVVNDHGSAYLTTLPDNSVDGIFGAQIIEHLLPRDVIELVRLCHRKLAPGAALVLETPNPKCLMVFADSFYKDPSHIQPAHPDTMRFLFEATGFQDVDLKFLAPVDPGMRLPRLAASTPDVEAFNHGVERLNTLLFGFQDFAVIGRKAPATPAPDGPA